MLTDSQVSIIKATVPVLKVHAETITRTFYRNMLEEHPELKNIFNMANQAKGDQPRSLAASVLAYAENIDQLQNLGPAVSLIAHKHCSLDVLPEHYPIVGRNLLRAIGEVLGDAATPEIVAAWAEAYGQLAEILIGAEDALYRANSVIGWTGFKPFRVTQRIEESSVITSFTLEPEDGKPLPLHKPGQYLSIKLEGAGPYIEMRQYTISCAPNVRHYRISVKREEGGAVSGHLHRQMQVGDTLLVHMPHGDFTLDESISDPVVLISGGVGITPVLAMLERLVESGSGRPVTFIHATQGRLTHAFGNRLREIAAAHPNVSVTITYEFPRPEDTAGLDYHREGRIDLSLLQHRVPAEADCYICGPKPFMKLIDGYLTELGVPAERRKKEVFGPTLEFEAVPA